jgi:hypothetical protein
LAVVHRAQWEGSGCEGAHPALARAQVLALTTLQPACACRALGGQAVVGPPAVEVDAPLVVVVVVAVAGAVLAL